MQVFKENILGRDVWLRPKQARSVLVRNGHGISAGEQEVQPCRLKWKEYLESEARGYKCKPVQIGLSPWPGKGTLNLFIWCKCGKIWGKETFIMCLRALNPLPI